MLPALLLHMSQLTILDTLIEMDNKTSANPVSSPYDYVATTFPNSTQEVTVFRLGGSTGTIVKTVTVTYADSSKSGAYTVVFT